MEGVWIYSKILFWTLGINVLFAYDYLGYFTFQDFLKVIKKVTVVAFLLTIHFVVTGFIKQDYNVAAYLVLFIYPILLYSSDKFTKNLPYLVMAAISILITLKRGAIIAFAVSNIIYYLYGVSKTLSIKLLFRGVLIVAVMGIMGFFFYESQKSTIADRFSEEQFDINNDKAGSGRVGMYTRLYEGWLESDSRLLGLGNQADTHRRAFRRTHAHSDIFGFLYNHGIVGIALIFLLYINILRFHHFYKKMDPSNSHIVIISLIVLVLVNLYSGLLRSTEAFYIFAIFPYLQLKNTTGERSIDSN